MFSPNCHGSGGLQGCGASIISAFTNDGHPSELNLMDEDLGSPTWLVLLGYLVHAMLTTIACYVKDAKSAGNALTQ